MSSVLDALKLPEKKILLNSFMRISWMYAASVLGIIAAFVFYNIFSY